MSIGENEILGIYYRHDEKGKILLGSIRNRFYYDSRPPVHRQVWDVSIGRTRVECDSMIDAMETARKIAERVGFSEHVSIDSMDRRVLLAPRIMQRFPKSDYAVGQRLVLTVPVEHDALRNKSECIAAECEVREVDYRGSKGWWIRFGYEGGEFAAIESMDGRLEVQAPVGSEAAPPEGDGLQGCVNLHTAIRGVR